MPLVRAIDPEAVVLVVDDLADNLALLRVILRRAGYQNVHCTSNPQEVVRLYRDLKPEAVLLDLHMPTLDGFEVLRLLAAEVISPEELPVLMLTADLTPDLRERALALGAKDFIAKPFDIDQVARSVQQVIDQGRARPRAQPPAN